jgi:hypothetical protein
MAAGSGEPLSGTVFDAILPPTMVARAEKNGAKKGLATFPTASLSVAGY